MPDLERLAGLLARSRRFIAQARTYSNDGLDGKRLERREDLLGDIDKFMKEELERDMKAFAREEGMSDDFAIEHRGGVAFGRPRRQGWIGRSVSSIRRWLRRTFWRFVVWEHMRSCQSCGEGRPGRCSFWDEVPSEMMEEK